MANACWICSGASSSWDLRHQHSQECDPIHLVRAPLLSQRRFLSRPAVQDDSETNKTLCINKVPLYPMRMVTSASQTVYVLRESVTKRRRETRQRHILGLDAL